MYNSFFLNIKIAFLKPQNNYKTTIDLHNISTFHNLSNSKVGNPSNLKKRFPCMVILMTFLLMTSIMPLLTPYQSITVLATNNLQESTVSPEGGSNSNESVSSSQSAKQTDPFPDTNTCLPGQIEGPFENCTDPVCEPGQVLGNDHTCTNPSCPPGMEYNEEVGECMSDDLPPDTTCPDGSKGTIRNGPNGITLIECPKPYPDSNPPTKPGLDRGNIDIKDGVLENPDSNPPTKPGLDRGNIDNAGVLKE